MRLKTLGSVVLEDSSFTRVKPLLLLSYLVLEGGKDRRYIAEFFWPTASDSLNSLSRALSQLRKGAPGALGIDDQRIWPTLESDVSDFLRALEAKNYAEAVELYTGPFLQGAYLSDWGVELEEWIYEQRETLAARAQDAMLELAETYASQGRFSDAARLAEQAFELEGAPAPEPELLPRYYALLVAGNSHLISKVKEEAEFYDITVDLAQDEARGRLQSTFVGRDQERARLEGLAPGQWAWLRGAAGMGKTTLLKSLSGTYLQARSGLPYATLEPLLGTTLEEGKDLMLRKLSQLQGHYLFDPWEWMDEESQALLRQLRDLRPEATIIIASRAAPPFRVDVETELAPISQDDLARFEGAWEKTEGLPALVGAFLRGEPVEQALETRLHTLPDEVERVYLGLALLEQPDPALVRRALGLKAADMADAFERLIRSGLTDVSGRVRAQQAAQDYLDSRPLQVGKLALNLARQLEGTTAFPLYSKARLLWEDHDLTHVTNAYLAWANELLRRGFPQRASEVLGNAPEGMEVTFLQARALERAGRFQEAFDCAKNLDDTPDLLALMSVLYYRLGKPDEAKEAAEKALEGGSVEARAEALNTLGHQARFRGEYENAADYFRRAATLWQAQGNGARRADALNNLGIAYYWLEKESEEIFNEALDAAGDNRLLRSRVLLNLGVIYEKQGQFERAKERYLEITELADKVGASEIMTRAWNNLGWIYQQQDKKEDAEEAYKKALPLAQQTGEQEMLGMILANLAELSEDFNMWLEALRILKVAGQEATIERFWEELPNDHPFRLRSETKV